MAASSHFEFRKGEDVVIHWTIRVADADTAAVVDLTGWTFAFKLKRQDVDADPSLVAGTTAILVAASGTCDTTITAAEMGALEGDYRYSLWRTNSGALACLSQGYYSVVDTVQN